MVGVTIFCLLLLIYWIITPNNSKYKIDYADYQEVERVFVTKLPEGTVIIEIVTYGGIDESMFVKLTIKSDKLNEFCSNTNIDMTKINREIEGPITNWWEMEPKEFNFEYENNSKYFIFSKPEGGIITILMSDSLA